MFAFIQAQPNIVERLLRHIETPAFTDILVRMIQLDELPSCAHVLEVCSLYLIAHISESSSYPKAYSGSLRRI